MSAFPIHLKDFFFLITSPFKVTLEARHSPVACITSSASDFHYFPSSKGLAEYSKEDIALLLDNSAGLPGMAWRPEVLCTLFTCEARL